MVRVQLVSWKASCHSLEVDSGWDLVKWDRNLRKSQTDWLKSHQHLHERNSLIQTQPPCISTHFLSVWSVPLSEKTVHNLCIFKCRFDISERLTIHEEQNKKSLNKVEKVLCLPAVDAIVVPNRLAWIFRLKHTGNTQDVCCLIRIVSECKNVRAFCLAATLVKLSSTRHNLSSHFVL